MTRVELDETDIRKHLTPQVGIKILESTTSTNDVVKEMLQDRKEPFLLVATNKQTAGRGRRGRTYFSDLAHGLYFSIAFRPQTRKIEEIPQYTLLAVVALVESLEKMTGKQLGIKWVNDVFYEGRKISGILSEMVTTSELGVVVGVGINFSGDFTETTADIQQVAGTLFGKKTPEYFNQNVFLTHFIERFIYHHNHFDQKLFLPIYEERLLGVGELVYYESQNKKYQGFLIGINDQGHLRVEHADGEVKTLHSQEVHFGSAQFLS